MDWTTSIPSLLSSAGALFSLLIQSSPLSVPRRLRGVVAAIYVLIVWLGYFLSLQISAYLFYSPLLTIVPLSLGLCLMVVTLFKLLAVRGDSFNVTPDVALMYLIGLLFITVSFTNYLSSKDLVVIMAVRSSSNRLDLTRTSNGSPSKISSRVNNFGSGVVLTKTEFDKIDSLTVTVDSQTTELKKDDFHLEPRGLGQVLYVN